MSLSLSLFFALHRITASRNARYPCAAMRDGVTDERAPGTVPPERRHRDWLTSGSNFGHTQFASLIDAVATGMLTAR